MRFFITGSAGFIGFHLAKRLLDNGDSVHGYDGMTPQNDTGLKHLRLSVLRAYPNYTHVEAMLEDKVALTSASQMAKPDVIVHLAAQAGVRYSLESPETYAQANLMGTLNILDVARQQKVSHLLLASSSSVYGAGETSPFKEDGDTSHPLSFYGATKKALEVMAHAYAHLWRIPTTVFRPFTIYGPYGRPDMALFKFVEAAEHNQAIEIYGDPDQMRDFTYIDDLIEAIVQLIPIVPGPPITLSGDTTDTLSPTGPFRVVNIGGGHPVSLSTFVDTIEGCLGKPIGRQFLPDQRGDVPYTNADLSLLHALTGYKPVTPLRDGIAAFVTWYKNTHDALSYKRQILKSPAL